MADVDSPPSFGQFFSDLITPAVLFMWSFKHYVIVVSETVFVRRQILAPILNSSKVRDEAFGRFWVDFSGPPADPTTTLNDQGVPDTSKLSGSAALIPPLLEKMRGVVLDVGPGTGSQMAYFVQPALKNNSTIYGAEPCVGLHAALKQRVAAYGLESKYNILSAGAEKVQLVDALRREGVQVNDDASNTTAKSSKVEDGGVFDTIVCVRVLCSVPNPEETIAGLYSLLRPGGQMLIVEHVINSSSAFGSCAGGKNGRSFLARVSQMVYMSLGWRLFVGDCHLNRDTETYLRNAAEKDGGRKLFDLKHSFGWSPLPYISGVLVKRGGDS